MLSNVVYVQHRRPNVLPLSILIRNAYCVVFNVSQSPFKLQKASLTWCLAYSKLLRLRLLTLKFSLVLRKNKAHMYNKTKNASTKPQKLNLFLTCEYVCANMFSLTNLELCRACSLQLEKRVKYWTKHSAKHVKYKNTTTQFSYAWMH